MIAGSNANARGGTRGKLDSGEVICLYSREQAISALTQAVQQQHRQQSRLPAGIKARIEASTSRSVAGRGG